MYLSLGLKNVKKSQMYILRIAKNGLKGVVFKVIYLKKQRHRLRLDKLV
jgi:hypothetical protein